ncbi:unnamed protein product [Brachionus calyciflorus]|uniref:DDE-1 domain-containing protein n=1 Tax=Brachionus calyciflorus TaxID=104777 RepID=A0A814GHT4_9BILA|nr:unnamed protein product [Brachionus calyciflorus]
MLNNTYKLSDNVCKMGRFSKERITVFVWANMLRDKLPLLVLSKKFFRNAHSAWNNDVKSSTISNCFRQFGFFDAKVSIEAEQEGTQENLIETINKDLEQLEIAYGKHFSDSNFSDFIDYDNNLQTSKPLEITAIGVISNDLEENNLNSLE